MITFTQYTCRMCQGDLYGWIIGQCRFVSWIFANLNAIRPIICLTNSCFEQVHEIKFFNSDLTCMRIFPSKFSPHNDFCCSLWLCSGHPTPHMVSLGLDGKSNFSPVLSRESLNFSPLVNFQSTLTFMNWYATLFQSFSLYQDTFFLFCSRGD